MNAQNNDFNQIVHRSYPHESAVSHVEGSANYVDDLPELSGTLHAALGLSPYAYAKINSLDVSAVKAYPGVVRVLTAEDVIGVNDCGPIVHDDPIFAKNEVGYIGQPMFAVVAKDREVARRAAKLAKINATLLPPILSIEEGHAQKNYVVPPVHLKRGDPQKAMAKALHRLKDSFRVGGQEQFYLEGQIAYALPKEGGIHLYSSTQHPTEMQQVVAHALDIPANRVVVETRRMGGGFGGKESQSAIFAAVASLAAYLLQKPVKLRPDRDDDMLITGKRHGFLFHYEVGFDENGVIVGATIDMLAQAGYSADLSGPVITRALCHFDNAYFLENVAINAFAVRTHTQSNTAFRGFGGPQGALAIENIIESIARILGKDPLAIRRANFYGVDSRCETPYGQKVTDNVIQPLIDELVRSSDYLARRARIENYNQQSPIIKHGIAITPVKFGISFNVKHYNQAGAWVHVYTDGSVRVNHGGTEMGQGLHTKVAQVVAQVLGVPLSKVQSTATDTSKVPNTSATAASTGADLNGKAAENAAHKIRTRLVAWLVDTLKVNPDEISFNQGLVRAGTHQMTFAQLCQQAYSARIQLWADGFYATPNIHWDRLTVRGSPFYYFAYGAAVSEVAIDTLTGEWKLLRADLLHDAGKSLNPAIDLGQIEGAFIQGMGWLTMEELWWNKEGKLMTHAPSTYKIPAVHDYPPIFNTALFKNENREDSIFRSKAVGEPPLLLSFSVFFALRHAVAHFARDKENPALSAPATPEAILSAITALRH